MATKTKEPAGPAVHAAHDALVPLDELRPNPANPNRHSDHQIEILARIIEQQGWRLPISVSKRSGYIVRGHGRLQAAQRLGLTVAPVDYQDYDSDEAELADLIADNRIAELAEVDFLALKDLLETIDTGVIDIALTGYTEDEILALIATGDYDPLAGLDDEPPDLMSDLSGVVPTSGDYLVIHFKTEAEYDRIAEWLGLKDRARSAQGTDLIAALEAGGLL